MTSCTTASRQRALATVVAVVAALVVLVAPAGADTSGSGAQRWASSYAYGAPAYSTAVASSADGATVFVTGVTDFGPSGRMGTLAYDASSGDRRWVDVFPGGAADEYGVGKVLTVGPDDSTLYVSGFSQCVSDCDASSFEGFSTVAYDASSGERLWVSRLSTTGGRPTSIGVGPDGSSVFVAGPDGLAGSHLVAYDATTGDRLWKVRRTKAEGYYGGDLSVSPDGGTVFVTDTAPPDHESCAAAGGYRTTAFATEDGAVRWSSLYSTTGSGRICGTPTELGLSPDGTAVYVTGYGSRSSQAGAGFYQVGTVALDAVTGDRLWATNDDDLRVLDGDTVVSLGVSPDGEDVYVLGEDCSDYPSCPLATAAYDATTGARSWLSEHDGGGRGYAGDLAMSPDGSSVFVTGQETMPCLAGCTTSQIDAPLVSYDTATGDVRWATTYADNLGVALAVSPDGTSVYLAGTFTGSAATSGAGPARATRSCGDRCGYSTARFNVRPGPGTLQESDPSLRLDGWRSVFDRTALGGAYRTSSDAGDVVTLRTPRATSVSWVTRQGPGEGKAKLVVDGHSQGTVDLYSPTGSPRTITVDGLDRASHTVRVKVLGRKNAASTGTSVALDAFTFRAGSGIAEETSPLVRYGSWAGREEPAASGGSIRRSGSPGARLAFAFKGRALALLTETGPGFGRARIGIDGDAHTIDLYRPQRHARATFSWTGLSSGAHRVVFRPLGTKNPLAGSTDVVVDAFVVRR